MIFQWAGMVSNDDPPDPYSLDVSKQVIVCYCLGYHALSFKIQLLYEFQPF
jgi:hypothetical protein